MRELHTHAGVKHNTKLGLPECNRRACAATVTLDPKLRCRNSGMPKSRGGAKQRDDLLAGAEGRVWRFSENRGKLLRQGINVLLIARYRCKMQNWGIVEWESGGRSVVL